MHLRPNIISKRKQIQFLFTYFSFFWKILVFFFLRITLDIIRVERLYQPLQTHIVNMPNSFIIRKMGVLQIFISLHYHYHYHLHSLLFNYGGCAPECGGVADQWIPEYTCSSSICFLHSFQCWVCSLSLSLSACVCVNCK